MENVGEVGVFDKSVARGLLCYNSARQYMLLTEEQLVFFYYWKLFIWYLLHKNNMGSINNEFFRALLNLIFPDFDGTLVGKNEQLQECQ